MSGRHRARRVCDHSHDRRAGTPRAGSPEELEIVISIEHTRPRTTLDDRLRREQAAALLRLAGVLKPNGGASDEPR